MDKKKIKVYLETRPLVKSEKQSMFDAYFKYSIQNEKNFKKFQKIAYVIKLMSNGANKSSFKPMFEDDPLALDFACSCVREKEKEKEME